MQPAEHVWPLTNTCLINRHFFSIEELEEVQFARCADLQRQPDRVQSATLFAMVAQAHYETTGVDPLWWTLVRLEMKPRGGVPMAKHIAPYPPEFRTEAIRLAPTSGKQHAEIARELGIIGETLRLWLKQADLDEGKRHDGLTSEEQEELRRLRRENRIVREEREILKTFRVAHGDAPADENGVHLPGRNAR